MKRGFVRDDGMVFLRRKKGAIIWGTKESWEKLEKNRLEYMKKRYAHYKSLPENQKFKIGDYNHETGLYFIRKSGNLNPIWGTKDQLDAYRSKRRNIRKSYREKLSESRVVTKNSHEIKRRRGDIDPVLNLIFFRYNTDSGKELWMSPQRWEEYKKKYYKKYKEIL